MVVVALAYCEAVLNACSPEAPHDGDDLKLAWGRRGGMRGEKHPEEEKEGSRGNGRGAGGRRRRRCMGEKVKGGG